MDYSILKIVNLFRELSENHLDIESFDVGFEFDIETQKQSNQNYVQLFVELVSTQVNVGRSNSTNDRRFRLYVYDLIKQDNDNYLSVFNDCELILIDIIRQFNYGSKDYKVVNSPILLPFKDKYGENVTGYLTEVSIQTAELNGSCFIPLKN
jgi:hypothetical protein